jgi:hypothetical protein
MTLANCLIVEKFRVVEYVRMHSRAGLSQHTLFQENKVALCRPTLREFAP